MDLPGLKSRCLQRSISGRSGGDWVFCSCEFWRIWFPAVGYRAGVPVSGGSWGLLSAFSAVTFLDSLPLSIKPAVVSGVLLMRNLSDPLFYLPLPFFRTCVIKLGFQVALAVKNPAASAGYAGSEGSIPGWGRSPAGGHGNSPQYSCLENPMDRGAWGAIPHGVT